MAYWLVKTESNVYSIDDLARDKVTDWHGVRNYQARNFLKSMKVGEEVLFYHSVEEPVGIVGLAKVVTEAYADKSQFDKKSEYFDQKASKNEPRWFSPDIKFIAKFPKLIPIANLKKEKHLKGMELLRRGSRLSVQPVSALEFDTVIKMSGISSKGNK